MLCRRLLLDTAFAVVLTLPGQGPLLFLLASITIQSVDQAESVTIEIEIFFEVLFVALDFLVSVVGKYS